MPEFPQHAHVTNDAPKLDLRSPRPFTGEKNTHAGERNGEIASRPIERKTKIDRREEQASTVQQARADQWLEGKMNEETIEEDLAAHERSRKALERELIEVVASHRSAPTRPRPFLLPLRLWFDRDSWKEAKEHTRRQASNQDLMNTQQATEAFQGKLHVLAGLESGGAVRYSIDPSGLALIRSIVQKHRITKLDQALAGQDHRLLKYSATLRLGLPSFTEKEFRTLIQMLKADDS